MSKISYDALNINGLKDIFIQISDACKKLGIDFFIVGAIARNIWYASNNESLKGTKDIDFGVYISDANEYNLLKEILKKDYNYTESSENAFCLITQNGRQIDLLPFGEIGNESQVLIDGSGLTKISLDGFKEAYEFGVIEVNIGDEVYKSCSIPGVMILKLIAFDDRPEVRSKDIEDVNSICQYYPSIESNFIWEKHYDLYDGELEHDEVGTIVLGREMKKLISGNQKLKNRLISIMDKAITEKSNLLTLMIKDSENETIETKRKVIELVKKGFIEEKSS